MTFKSCGFGYTLWSSRVLLCLSRTNAAGFDDYHRTAYAASIGFFCVQAPVGRKHLQFFLHYVETSWIKQTVETSAVQVQKKRWVFNAPGSPFSSFFENVEKTRCFRCTRPKHIRLSCACHLKDIGHKHPTPRESIKIVVPEKTSRFG